MKTFLYTLKLNRCCYIIFFTLLLACSSDKKEEHANNASVTKALQLQNKNDLMLSDSQIKLANITTHKIGFTSIGQSVVVNGKLVVDQELSEVISSRATGRVDKLFIKETGRLVSKGEPLYELYSETLLTLQQEYLLAKEQVESLGKNEARYNTFLQAAERKLILYGLSKKQVDQLGKSKSVKQRVTILAPTSGIVTEINVTEGQYVTEGATMYKVEAIHQLWLEAELYPQETARVKIGDKIEVVIRGYESRKVEAKVIFISPNYGTNSLITIIRAAIKNSDMELKPGMQTQVRFTNAAKQTVAIPTDAVIRDGNGTHVYVQTDSNTFQPRMVTIGIEDSEQVEITEGLKENEVVAVSGAYLLYSELILKKGTDPMAGHNH